MPSKPVVEKIDRVPHTVLDRDRITAPARRILNLLITEAGDDNKPVQISRKDIWRRTGVPLRTVNQACGELHDKAFVIKSRVQDPVTGADFSNEFQVLTSQERRDRLAAIDAAAASG